MLKMIEIKMGLSQNRVFHLLVFMILLVHDVCHSEKAPQYTFVREATSAPAISRFDYIIIGGGTAGCPLAATLSQNATVLVLERGVSPYKESNATDIDRFITNLANTSPDSPSQIQTVDLLNNNTLSQDIAADSPSYKILDELKPFVSEDGVYNTRARVLGGGSVLNAGFYTRASRGYVRDAGWDEGTVNSSYQWVERKLVHEPPVLGWQSAVRDGLIEAGVKPYNGFTYDHISGTKIGGTIFDRDGHRHSAADLLEYADPERIVVYLHATVHKILFITKGRRKPRAYGVIFEDANGVLHTVEVNNVNNPTNEIIVSAGAMGSPQLLMLSGVGPEDQLRAHGIEVLMDHPMVGKGMGDNPMNALFTFSPVPVEISLIQTVGITEFGSYIETASGFRLPYSQDRPQTLRGLVSSLLNKTGETSTISSRYIANLLTSVDSLLDGTIQAGIIVEKIDGPISRGHLELRTADPKDTPAVTFNYFKEPEDLRKCVQGMETIINVVNSEAFSKYRYPGASIPKLLGLMLSLPTNLRARHPSAVFDLEQFCIDTVLTIWHYHGGCQVGRVVDRKYRVKGVDALRVIDGSTFLTSPGTNPQATLMMLGRYMGLNMLQERMAYQERKNKK